MCQETLMLGQNVGCVANIRDYSRELTALVWGYRSTVGHDLGEINIRVRFSVSLPIYWGLV